MTLAAIVVPTQGEHHEHFQQVATAVKRVVYDGDARILQTTLSDSGAVTFQEGSTAVSWADLSGLKTVITISHAGMFDGPNLDFGRGDISNQPWRSEGTGSSRKLADVGRAFWTSVGSSLLDDGKIILMGCYMGEDYDPDAENFVYAEAVAKATGKPVYGSDGLIAAADRETTLQHVRTIERGGVRRPMKLYKP